MLEVWNPTPRPIFGSAFGVKLRLEPGERKRLDAKMTSNNELVSAEVQARKYLDDARQVGLVVLTDKLIEEVSRNEGKLESLADAAKERLIEFCRDNIAHLNNLNAEQVANSKAPLRAPDSTKECLLLLCQLEGVDDPDELGMGFLSTRQLRKMRENPQIATRVDAHRAAVETGSAEEGDKVLQAGGRRNFPGAPSDTQIDPARRTQSSPAVGRARAARAAKE